MRSKYLSEKHKVDFKRSLVLTSWQKLLPLIHPNQDLLSGVFYFVLVRGSAQYGSYRCKGDCISSNK